MTKTELTTKLAGITDLSALTAEINDAADDAAIPEILKRYNLELTAEDIRTLLCEEDELDEDSLEDVTGGCKCKGPLKRLIINVLHWIIGKASGRKFTCDECGD